MNKKQFILAHRTARANAVEFVANAPDGSVVEVREPSRNLAQNALLWSVLQAFSDQLDWPVNGRMTKLGPDDWKTVLSAAFRQETARVAMGLDGNVVMLGCSTSKMGKKEFSEFIEFVLVVAAERGVELHEEHV